MQALCRICKTNDGTEISNGACLTCRTSGGWHIETPFPVGAWVRDTFGQRLGAEIIREHGGVRFNPTGGEIISIGTIAKSLAYRVKFAEAESVVLVSNCVCYSCGAPDDNSHESFCADKSLRALPHEPGYAA